MSEREKRCSCGSGKPREHCCRGWERAASASAESSGTGGPTERLPPAGRERDKLLERVAKLYRMSGETESSPHEAAIALRRCQALMNRFGITEADLQSSEFGVTTLKANVTRLPAHALFLAQAVALLHDCIVVRGAALEFRGYALDADVAALTFDYLSGAMERSLAVRKREGSVAAGRAPAFDYRVGYAMSVMERCREIDRERREAERKAFEGSEGGAKGGRSLVVRKLEAVERECAQGLAHGRRRHVRVRSGDAHTAGGADGREVSLSTQIGTA